MFPSLRKLTSSPAQFPTEAIVLPDVFQPLFSQWISVKARGEGGAQDLKLRVAEASLVGNKEVGSLHPDPLILLPYGSISSITFCREANSLLHGRSLAGWASLSWKVSLASKSQPTHAYLSPFQTPWHSALEVLAAFLI